MTNETPFDLERMAWLLESLAREMGRDPQRGELRRALEESRAALSLDHAGQWWKPLIESGGSQGLHLRLVDCQSTELESMLLDGGRAIAIGRTEGLVALKSGRRGRFHVTSPRSSVHMTSAELETALIPIDETGRIRVLLAIPVPTGEQLEPATPLSRLYALLQPELTDVWTVLVFSLVAGLLGLATPLAVEALVNTVSFGKLFQPVVVLSIMLMAFLSFAGAIKALQTLVVDLLQRRLFARVMGDLAYRLPRTPIEGFDSNSGRELVNRFMEIVTVQKVVAQFLLDGLSLVLATFIGMAVLGFYHPWLLGFDLLLILLIFAGLMILGRGAVQTSIKESKTKYQALAWIEDVAGSPLAFRLGGASEFVLERTDKLTHNYLTARRKHFSVLYRQILFALGVQALASTVLLGLGGWLVINQQLSLGQLVASELIVTTIVGAFAKLGKHLEAYYDVMAAVDKLGALFDLPIERQGGLLSFSTEQPVEVDVNSISASSADGEIVLADLSLHLKPGAKTVLTGPSGSGKSLLLELLFGLRWPESGHISINDVDIRNYRPEVLRRHISLVRDVEVFEATVAENVHLGRREISDADVRQALDDVGLLEDILSLPEGTQSTLNAVGAPLTQNQLRKLMLARAIVSRPHLLLIDGLLDALPDQSARDLATLISRTDQPWTLVLVSGHEQLRQGLRQVELTKRRPKKAQEQEHVG
ncbi:MAG: ATP-binding cassette domain-containing protein [Planctomycetaceae bacterium]|nr:ATP-binding cassette domain-containing protein [Planctomycetaceae bacterium]